MNEARERQLLEGGLRFFGRIMASLSHEINNVISIVSELSGLLRDHAALAERGKPLNLAKLTSILDNIDKQVARGKTMIANMNHFAHGIDDPLREIVLDDLVANVVQLGQRFASQKGAELVAADLKQAPIIAGNPYLVRQALFLCLDLVLEGLPSAGTITISARSEPGGVLLLMSSPALNYAPEFDRKIAYLKIVAEELRGVAQAQILPDQTHLFSLLLPRA